ncbi:MAG: sulfurtransferase [Simplicispira suum]|uniref:rhodanese-like domain-containing protein n=1 Tax=Simplicispira suum TaxID=2109915 RepID=UPI001C6D0B7B|nr:rhodanese-like domain-containing protein [Simplicispira suum]MBW7833036.1 sulfurtransferase [Simplicispira suum]
MVDQVRPSALAAWFEAEGADAAPLVLDVREPWEVALASIQAAGFELRAIPMASVPAQLAALDPDQPVACLCHHGARSQNVALFLERNGFAHVANIAGGINAWSGECDPAVPRY